MIYALRDFRTASDGVFGYCYLGIGIFTASLSFLTYVVEVCSLSLNAHL
jgi:hypothetical protein